MPVTSTPARQTVIEQLAAKGIHADPPEHAHLRPQAGGGDGLVSALAARHSTEITADHRLASVRDALAARHQVHVNAAYYDYFRLIHS